MTVAIINLEEEWTLTASLNGETETLHLYNTGDPLGAGFGVTLSAIDEILTRAQDSELWARGSVVLSDPSGLVVRTMVAKDDDDGNEAA